MPVGSSRGLARGKGLTLSPCGSSSWLGLCLIPYTAPICRLVDWFDCGADCRSSGFRVVNNFFPGWAGIFSLTSLG